MSTEWKSQQGDGKYSLQFETDNKENYKLMEKVAQMIIDGKSADIAEVVRCKDCYYYKEKYCVVKGEPPCIIRFCGLTYATIQPDDFCCCGERVDKE